VGEGVLQLPADGTGKKLRTLTGGAAQPADTHQEVDTLAHPDGTLVGPGAGLAVALDTNGQLTSLLTELGQKLEPGQAVALDAATLAALESITAAVTGTVEVSNLPATQAVSGPLTDAQLRAAKVGVADDFQAGEVLADQTGAGAVLTFTFAAARNLVLIQAVGAGQVARADPFGGTPSATQGIRCDDATPTYLPVTATVVRVHAPAGMVVSCAGFSRT